VPWAALFAVALTMTHKVFLDWSDIEALAINAAHEMTLSDNSEVKHFHLIALARGGWIPTRMIGGLLEGMGCKVTYQSVFASSYTGESQGDLYIESFTVPDCDLAIIVDDLVDSGKTMKAAMAIAELSSAEVRSCVLIEKDCSEYLPTYRGDVQEGGTWIVFPYETEAQYHEQE